MSTVDLGPAAERLSELVTGVDDSQLTARTPCPEYTLGDLIEHVGGLAQAFTAAANKVTGALTSQAPRGDAARLPADWRTRIPLDLKACADAWRDPAAWTGMTRAGGVDLPGEVGGLVALDEITIHAWDIAVSSGQSYAADQATLTTVRDFLASFSIPGAEDQRGDIFGPVIEVPQDAPLQDRVIGLAGRDPAWSAEPDNQA
ncbi:MAG: TIGR03086 family metal-binding protein [Nakamurella sp.]